MPLKLVINGQERTFAELAEGANLAQVVQAMELKGDRIAVEHNGEIAPRVRWAGIAVAQGDRLEIVHFVGGGSERGSSQGLCAGRNRDLKNTVHGLVRG